VIFIRVVFLHIIGCRGEKMKKKLGDLLVEAGFIDENQLTAGLGEQQQWGGKLGTVLVGKGFISEADLLRVLARQMGVEFVSIWKKGINPNALKLIKQDVAKENNIFPYATNDDVINVAMTDPRNLKLIDEINFATGKKLKPALADLEEIKLAIRKYYNREVIQDWEFDALVEELERKTHATMPDPSAFGKNIEIGEGGAVEVNNVELEAPDLSAMPTDHMSLLSESEAPKPKPKPKQQARTKRSPIVIEKTLVSLINVLIRNGVISKEDLIEEMKDKQDT
jgi:type IV pilus assembly protein PilB